MPPTRERLVAHGADALSHAELIGILLRTGFKGTNAVEAGRQLVQKYGSLQSLAQASVEELQTFKGIGKGSAAIIPESFYGGSAAGAGQARSCTGRGAASAFDL